MVTESSKDRKPTERGAGPSPDPDTRSSPATPNTHPQKVLMKSKLSLLASSAALVLASSVASQAASITVDTVGVINPIGKTPILEATGNSTDVTSFSSIISTAFSNDTGGVWNFDTVGGFTINSSETITLKYGTSLANSLVLTMTGTAINQGVVGGEPTSGTGELGLTGDASTRTFTFDKPLLSIGIISADRNDVSRIPSITVTFQDNSTASTSGANANDYFFHSISGTSINPIVSMSLVQSNFIRYDDFAFVTAVPEPASAATLVGLAAVGFVALRRRRAQS